MKIIKQHKPKHGEKGSPATIPPKEPKSLSESNAHSKNERLEAESQPNFPPKTLRGYGTQEFWKESGRYLIYRQTGEAGAIHWNVYRVREYRKDRTFPNGQTIKKGTKYITKHENAFGTYAWCFLTLQAAEDFIQGQEKK